jgi:hypothetical protein
MACQGLYDRLVGAPGEPDKGTRLKSGAQSAVR